MGKRSTAARAARRSTGGRKTSIAKISNKKSQNTPKAVRKQQNRANERKKEHWSQIYGNSEKRLSSLSWNNFEKKIEKDTTIKDPNDIANNINRRRKKKLNKNQLENDKKDKEISTIDFSTYDREVHDDLESNSDNDSDNNNNNGNNSDIGNDDDTTQYEMSRIGNKQAFSWDETKDRLPRKSAQTGQWEAVDDKVESKDTVDINDLYNIDLLDDDDDDNINNNENDSEIEDFDMDASKIDDYLNLGDEDNDDDDEEEDIDLTYDDFNEMKEKNNNKRSDRLVMSQNEWKLRKRQRTEALKLEIADIGEKILQDPYIHCRLFDLLFSLLSDQDVEIAQYSMLSLTRSIIDVMPPYRIGTMSNDAKLKKENERVREFEQTLVKTYQKFLKFLFSSEQIFHSNVNHRKIKRESSRFIIAKCAVKCSCLFLRKASHFNYTKELIKRTIPLLNSPDKWVRNEAYLAVSDLLSQEPISNVTVEAVSSICGKIESRNFECYEENIDVLLSLPLKLLHPPDVKVDDDREKPTKSKREKKLEAMVSKDLKELDSFDKKKEYERQKLIIESIFGVYFYILKLDTTSKLLACSLRGMAKFAQLVNVELVVNLVFAISKKLEEESDSLPLEAKLNCILTTFGCITGRGTAIEVDLKQHYSALYSILVEMIYPYHWQHFNILFNCVALMFGKKHNAPVERSAAFIKRLMTLSLHLPPHLSIGCMHSLRKIMILDNRLQCMLDYEGGYDAVYDKYNNNPDFTNALGCCLWECVSNANNYHLFNKQYCRDLCKLNDIPIYLAVTSAANVSNEYNFMKNGCFKPNITVGKNSKRKYSVKRQLDSSKDLNNKEMINEMIDKWFDDDFNFNVNVNVNGGENNDKIEMKNNYFAVAGEIDHEMNDQDNDNNNNNNVINECIDYFVNCNKLYCTNKTLSELKEHYLSLNELLVQD